MSNGGLSRGLILAARSYSCRDGLILAISLSKQRLSSRFIVFQFLPKQLMHTRSLFVADEDLLL